MTSTTETKLFSRLGAASSRRWRWASLLLLLGPGLLALSSLGLSGCQATGDLEPAGYPPGHSGREQPVEEQPAFPVESDPGDGAFGEPGGFAQPPARAPSAPEPMGADRAEAPSTADPRPRPESAAPDTGRAPAANHDSPEGAVRSDQFSAPSRASRSGTMRRRPVHEPRPREERPGLATHWGENRYSPAHEVSFERASQHPAVTERLRYDDRRGAYRQLPHGYWSRVELVSNRGLVIRMVDEWGRSFEARRHGNQVVAVGEPGQRYSLQIENPTSERFEIVATVDGLDVLDGESGSLAKRGYLVDAYTTIGIDGFRRSSREVAAFRLGDVSGSYAAGKGKARNVGVIGVAVFAEKSQYSQRPFLPRPHDHERYLRETANPFPGGYARPPYGR